MIDESATPVGPVRLRALGSLELTGPDAPALGALLSHPKRVALLVYLAVARPHGQHRRDALLALLWPESDQTRARHALSQVLYQLRRALGGDALRGHGDETVGLVPERVWCDVVAFEAALAENRPEDAVELYRGDFLAGFFVPGAAGEWEEWIAVEQSRLRSAAAGAAWTLAQREERAGNGTAAAHWARRAAALTPDDEHAVRELIRLLGRLGDRTGALRVYDEFTRRLQQEFAIKPSSELRAIAEALRRTPLPAAPPAASGGASPPAAVAQPASPPSLRRRSWRVIGLAGAAVVGALSIGLVRLVRSSPQLPTLAVGAVSDISRGDTGVPAPVAVDLLATSLARLPAVQVIASARLYELESQLQTGHPAATLFDAAVAAGARQVIQGTLHAVPNGVRLDLQRIDVAGGAVRAAYRVEGGDLFAAVDQATLAIARDLHVTAPDKPVTDVTTRSLLAYRLYEEGLRAYYQLDVNAADRLFRAALDDDSTFAMAAYWVWVIRGDLERPFLERAGRLADRATDRERLLIRAKLAEAKLQPVAVALAETLAYRYPNDPDAQLTLGLIRPYRGDFLGAIGPLEQVIRLDSLSLSGHQPQCRACDAFDDVGTMYVYADSFPAALRSARTWIARQPTNPRAWIKLSGVFELEGLADSALAAFLTADSLTPLDLPEGQLRDRLAIRMGNYDEADLRLRQRLADHTQSDADWFLVISLRNQGRLREAAALPAAQRSPLRSILAFEQGRFREAAVDFEAAAHPALAPATVIEGHVAKNLAFNLTQAATCWAAAGDTGRLLGLADSIESVGQKSLNSRELLLAHYVRGLLLRARGQPALAVEEYRKAVISWNEGYTRVNYALGQALLQTGRPREAVAALQPALRGSLEAANLYISRTELHELMAQAFDSAGVRDSALVHWRAVESAWRNADPEFRARWEVANERMRGDGGRR